MDCNRIDRTLALEMGRITFSDLGARPHMEC